MGGGEGGGSEWGGGKRSNSYCPILTHVYDCKIALVMTLAPEGAPLTVDELTSFCLPTTPTTLEEGGRTGE